MPQVYRASFLSYKYLSQQLVSHILKIRQAELRILLKKYERKYNCERMHQSLNYLAPMEYYYL